MRRDMTIGTIGKDLGLNESQTRQLKDHSRNWLDRRIPDLPNASDQELKTQAVEFLNTEGGRDHFPTGSQYPWEDEKNHPFIQEQVAELMKLQRKHVIEHLIKRGVRFGSASQSGSRPEDHLPGGSTSTRTVTDDTSCIDARHAPSHQRDSHSDDLSIDSSTVVLTYTLPVGSTQANGKRRRRNSSSPDVRSTPHQKDPENNQGEERVADHGAQEIGEVQFYYRRTLYEFRTNQEMTKALEFFVREQEDLAEHYRNKSFDRKASEQERKEAGVLCDVFRGIHAKFEEYLAANTTVLDR